MDCASLALQVAPVSYYCLSKIIGLRPKLGNTYYHIIIIFLFTANYTPSDMPALLCHLRDKYGDIIKLKTGMTSMVYIFHPDYAKTVFQAPYKEHAKTQMKLPETLFKRNNMPKGLVLL